MRRLLLRLHGRELRLHGAELTGGERHIQLVDDAALIADGLEAKRLAQNAGGLPQDTGLDLKSAQIDVGTHYVGDDRRDHTVACRGRRLSVVFRRFDFPAELAEQIELPHRVETLERIDLLEPAVFVAETRA